VSSGYNNLKLLTSSLISNTILAAAATGARQLTARHVSVFAIAILAGCVIRYAFLDHRTADYVTWLKPWWDEASTEGFSALAHGFTNYAPPYEYLLVVATMFGNVSALTGVKAISLVFEIANAVIAARIVANCGLCKTLQLAAAAALWLAPSVIYNGAGWGQADAIWTTFVLLGALASLRSRPSAGLAFGAAFAIKAQGIFAGPAALGLALRNARSFAALAIGFPLAVAALWVLPLLLGRDLSDVLMVYVAQSGTYHYLSANAANPWFLVPNDYYSIGVKVGLALALACGVAIAALARRACTPRQVLAVLALSCFAMPYVLPKMHDRYFYSGELLLILMAFADRRWLHLAVLAQVSAIYAYFVFDGIADDLIYVAVLLNTYVLGRAVTLVLSDLGDARMAGKFGGKHISAAST